MCNPHGYGGEGWGQKLWKLCDVIYGQPLSSSSELSFCEGAEFKDLIFSAFTDKFYIDFSIM